MWLKDFKKINLITDNPISENSNDHLMPWGTIRDCSINPFFNKKLYDLFKNKFIKILDLGCSGGGFIKNCIDDGHLAVGIEGSNYSQKLKRAHWATLSDLFLFTADITKKFTVELESSDYKKNLLFDIVTLWEVIEHINENDLINVCNNIKDHLLPSGLVIMSICPNEETINGVKLHQTVKEKKWWIDFFASQDLIHLPDFEKYFNGHYIRGPKQGDKNVFHLILSKDKNKKPTIPTITIKNIIKDFWFESYLQKKIRKLIIGI